ncbi:hypothetical protein V2G26_016434 [Clonostachys chloroleuca]
MNFQNLNFDYVEAPRQWPQQFQSAEAQPSDSESTIQQPQDRHRFYYHQQRLSHNQSRSQTETPSDSDFIPSVQSITPDFSFIPPAPSPPSPPPMTESTPEIYGPDRHNPLQQARRSFRFPSQGGAPSTAPSEPVVRFDESQLLMLAAQNANMASVPKDPLVIAAGKVTPGVDDTPYIQYAIQALTRNRRDDFDDDDLSEGDFEDEMAGVEPPPRRMSAQEMAYASPVAVPQAAYAGLREPRRHSSSDEEPPAVREKPKTDFLIVRPTPPLTPLPLGPPQTTASRPVVTPLPPSRRVPGADQHWVPVTKEMRENFYPNDNTYPPLTYKPRILRPFSMMILMTLCLLMTAALIFSAVFSNRQNGLTDYPGTIYSGKYFLFRILPQLLAAPILLYAQAIVSTSLRVLPFVSLSSEDARQRYLALFQGLYPTTFLWPRLVGPWQFKVFSVVAWLALFLIPLQSAAFTCIFGNGAWIWAPVQPVVWTLVTLYLLLTVATAILMVYWFGMWTGLIWDVRSIADLIPLLNRSNATDSYKDVCASSSTRSDRQFRNSLQDRWFDRLGYWRKEEMQTGGIWYSIGASGTPAGTEQVRQLMSAKGLASAKRVSNDSSRHSSQNELNIGIQQPSVTSCLAEPRFDYLPWCLRSAPLAALIVGSFTLLLALLIVSFLPQTRLDAGFEPLLPARPTSAAFSAANFLYSFLPSFLGMLLWLIFQSVELSLRIVQPWAELLKLDGALAHKSLLADYAACLPIQASWHAFRAGHWRVAVTSLMGILFLAIPVLSGGLFMALTRDDGKVLMFPSIPVYGVVLTFLFLYLACLSSILPLRGQFLLPRPVESLADLITFCCADELTQDAAFRSVRSRNDLEMRLGVEPGVDPREESVWFFGVVPGKDEKTLSIRRMRRYTEKPLMRRRSDRSMV